MLSSSYMLYGTTDNMYQIDAGESLQSKKQKPSKS